MSIIRWRRVWTTTKPTKGANARRSRYCINWIGDDGKKHRLCYPRRDVMLKAKQFKETEINSWSRPPMVRTWWELVAEYGVSLEGRSKTHQDKVANVLKRFHLICRPRQSNELSPATCEQFMAARSQGEPRIACKHKKKDKIKVIIPSPATRRTERQMLSGFFSWCTKRGYLPDNPMSMVLAPSKPRRVKRAPKTAEWVRLLEVLLQSELVLYDAQAWHLIILLGVVTGYRQTVLLNCYFGVSIQDTVTLRKLEARHPKGFCVIQLADDEEEGIGLLFTYSGKTFKETIIGLPKIVTDRIAQRISDLPSGAEKLFFWEHWQRKAWDRITQSANLSNITFHSLRATSGTRAAIARAEQAAAQQLDHSSPQVTHDHYLDHEQLARAIAIGQSLPVLPAMPVYEPLPANHATPGRRPKGIAQIAQLG